MTPENALVELFADKYNRNDAIVKLVGGITLAELREVKLRREARQALIDGLDHRNPKVRWWCLQLMDHLADDSFIPFVAKALDDPVGKIRRHAIHVLACDKCKPTRESLPGAATLMEHFRDMSLNDLDSRVREEASAALARLI